MKDCMFDEKKRYDDFPVAMAYVPWQKTNETYECLEKAFEEGTLFPILNKPFTGRRCI
ncbi:MAG: spore coat associated protein CotJA [Roseburia sp.]|nr:spore coat associated protein CotJA [Roseburia sp.]MCM1280106.1 spore coat associated protein CotJA [Robinsoniella sp.]